MVDGQIKSRRSSSSSVGSGRIYSLILKFVAGDEKRVVRERERERAFFGDGRRKKLEVRRGRRRSSNRRGRSGGCILLGRSMAPPLAG